MIVFVKNPNIFFGQCVPKSKNPTLETVLTILGQIISSYMYVICTSNEHNCMSMYVPCTSIHVH